MNVQEFKKHNFLDLLKNNYTQRNYIENKFHFKYLLEYLELMDTTFIVEEKEYVSEDYLDDFARYYSYCFERYSNNCRRIHFFSVSKSKHEFLEEFDEILLKGGKDFKTYFDTNYIGHIVIKPIPKTIIGFTLLRPLSFKDVNINSHNTTRVNFWGIKDYNINFFGNTYLFSSLAFQEQDQALSACATVSVWTMFQIASQEARVILKSPGEITHDAGFSFRQKRLFPNKGLTISEVCNAINKNNLVPEVREFGDLRNKKAISLRIKELIYAYSMIRIPIVFAVAVPEGEKESNGHAICISGHKLDETVSERSIDKEIHLLSEGITDFYVHDDQFVPFAKMYFDRRSNLKGPWTEILNNPTPRYYNPIAMIIPVLPKIRVDYEDIKAIVYDYHPFFTTKFKITDSSNSIFQIFDETKIVWDIRLMKNSDLKQKVRTKIKNNPTFIKEFLINPLPGYVWVATVKEIDSNKAYRNEKMSLVFDTSELLNGSLISCVVFYDNQTEELVKKLLLLIPEEIDDCLDMLRIKMKTN
jgi:hypothetical protein